MKNQQLVVRGGKPLSGKIISSGAKNAALKMVAAAALTDKTVYIDNVPHIQDVLTMLEIIVGMGGEVSWQSQKTVAVNCANINPDSIDQVKVGHLRGSVVLIGPLLARFGKIRIHEPGGCLIGSRSIAPHINGLTALGAQVSRQGKFYTLKAKKLVGATVLLDEMSVTATENILLAALLAKGETQLHLAACEPEISNLIELLKLMGADIRGEGAHSLIIRGKDRLGSARVRVIPDRIEIGSYALAIAATHGHGTIENVVPEHLFNLLNKFDRMGIKYIFENPAVDPKQINSLTIIADNEYSGVDFDTRPYPGFSTDLQAPMTVLLSQAKGKSKIFETLFEGRLNYIYSLRQMGAEVEIVDNRTIVISGPRQLKGRKIVSTDLRAGATFVIAGLAAHGTTIVDNAAVIDRGYEKIEEKLISLNANIERISDGLDAA